MSVNQLLQVTFGSHLYGTNTPESDLDLKGIYLPTAREIVLHSYPRTIQKKRPKAFKERNTKDDVDIELFSLDRFLELLTDGQTVALDLLFAPEIEFYSQQAKDIFQTIYFHKDQLLSRNINAFIGYARQQAAKYGIKGSRMDALKRVMTVLEVLPAYDRLNKYSTVLDDLIEETSDLVSLEKTPLIEKIVHNETEVFLQVCGRKVSYAGTVKLAKEIFGRILDNYGERANKAHLAGGADFKALSHAVRVNCEAMELLQTGHITFPRPERQLLIDIKTNKLPYEQVAELIESGLAELTEVWKTSTLRETPNEDWAKDFVFKIYSEIIKGEV